MHTTKIKAIGINTTSIPTTHSSQFVTSRLTWAFGRVKARSRRAMDTRGMNRTFEEFDAAVEWSRTADADAVKIILPGFKREEIRVLVDNHGHLRTRGERPVAGNKWSRFQKDFQLPADCNVDGIRAKFESEVLTITLPKKNPSPQAAAPLPPPMPASAAPMPEPRRPSMAPPQRPAPAIPEPAKPAPSLPQVPAVLPPAPSQKPVAERRPSLPRKPPVPEPAAPVQWPQPPPVAAPAKEVDPPKTYNGGAATTKKPLPGAVLKPKEDWPEETKVVLPPAVVEEEEKRTMEREARGKMEEDRKMVEEKEKKAMEEERVMEEMEMAQRRRPISANRGLLVNVAVAVVVFIGITVYVWRSLSSGAGVGGDHGHGEMGTGSFRDEM